MDKLLDGKHSRRDRLVGKLFGKDKDSSTKDRRPTNEESAADISSFLNTSDRLTVSHPVPPPPPATHPGLPALALDTSRVTRYPQAHDVGYQQPGYAQENLPRRPQNGSISRRPNRKGCMVCFADTPAEIIGVGGDECEILVSEIGRMKRSRSAPLVAASQSTRQGNEYRNAQASQNTGDDFVPAPIRRTQTGFSSIQDFNSQGPSTTLPGPPPGPPPARSPQPRALQPGDTGRTRFLDSTSEDQDKRRSFIEIQQHEQREAEGMAFAKARAASQDDEFDGATSSPEPVRAAPPQPRLAMPATTLPVHHSPVPSSPAHSFTSRTAAQRSPVPPPPASVSPPTPVRSDRDMPAAVSESPVGNLAPPTPPPKSASRSPINYQPPENQSIPTPFLEQVTPFGHPVEQELTRDYTNVHGSPSSTYSSSIYSPSDIKDAATVRSNSTRSYQTVSPDKQYPGNRLPDPFNTARDESLELFLQRTKHLYELFRLYAEQMRPLETCRPDDLCRAALWWFLKGRTALEIVIRNRGGDPEDPQQLMPRYQAYTDLAKAHWLAEEALPEIGGGRYSPISGELGDVRTTIQHNLTKLCGSMRRNNFLPPEEPFLPQTMDKSIWVEYPALNQDIIALLNGNAGSALAAVQQPARNIDLLEALPIGDTPRLFNYGRVNADVYLMEQGSGANQLHFPCVLSILRPQNDPQITFVVASQNQTIALRIGADKNVGPTWQDVRWRPDMCSLEVKLPRGFLLAIQLVNKDYGMLWSIYDFGSKVRSYLYSRKDETVVYKSALAGFHYFDSNPQARSFPKEAISNCELALFETQLKEGSPHGPRTFHRGFRIAVVTGAQTRTLSGVTHTYAPQLPLQFAYMRDDQRQPLLQLNFDDGKDRGRMVFRFDNDAERDKLLKLINGTYVHQDEEIVAETVLEGMQISEGLSDTKGGFPGVGRLPWQRARVINDKYQENAPVVLAEKLRIEIESMDKRGIGIVSTITDRINIAPGELRLRVGTKDFLTLQILRQNQVDMTVSLSENLAPRELAKEYAAMQESVMRNPTLRTFRFPSFKEMHTFQAAVTGYSVLFDAIASTFNVSRRRMVVPIHKKWEAGTTRIQVVQQDKTIQLLAFFENWSHGDCMGFVLKGTDTYECVSRSGKAGLKLCEAKFPLPRLPAEGMAKTDDMACLSLDMPEYAGENDDLTIFFEDSLERDRLCSVLPAPVKGSRLSKSK
ncbi:uncharacterized protein B0I36DRAFT_327255 [Microdochium trichocladiopsis]|uniref:Uncharacterized protein n=1 Tax=Microdochium trichocladiopsis TaxID=1682393 RepID=A0A9P8Y1K2_9PEZI|nr:uncharacterized protein B0I36DRAFT_327255 [Microdochium trichocladiopsis]KAH7027512.1 hypothetical protein B0I36DRAFT_327255 [Microdochium trichocladiopsis]